MFPFRYDTGKIETAATKTSWSMTTPLTYEIVPAISLLTGREGVKRTQPS